MVLKKTTQPSVGVCNIVRNFKQNGASKKGIALEQAVYFGVDAVNNLPQVFWIF